MWWLLSLVFCLSAIFLLLVDAAIVVALVLLGADGISEASSAAGIGTLDLLHTLSATMAKVQQGAVAACCACITASASSEKRFHCGLIFAIGGGTLAVLWRHRVASLTAATPRPNKFELHRELTRPPPRWPAVLISLVCVWSDSFGVAVMCVACAAVGTFFVRGQDFQSSFSPRSGWVPARRIWGGLAPIIFGNNMRLRPR